MMEESKMPSEQTIREKKEELMQEKQLNQALYPAEWT